MENKYYLDYTPGTDGNGCTVSVYFGGIRFSTEVYHKDELARLINTLETKGYTWGGTS